MACCNEELDEIKIEWQNKKSICVVLCSKGYPDKFEKNIIIKDLNKIKLDNNEYCYHAGTVEIKDEVYAVGGRVLSFVCLSEDFSKARKRIIYLIDSLNWNGGFFRKDIAYKVIDK